MTPAITVDGRRRIVALPSLSSLQRGCVVVDARQHVTGLTVRLLPDPEVWMR